MAGDSVPYAEVQAAFDAEVGAVPDLGEGSTIADLGGAPPVAAAPAAAPAPFPGFPPELYELVHRAAFARIGDKWRLSDEEAKLLGRCAAAYFNTIIPAGMQTPLGAYLGALLGVVVVKVGVAELTARLKLGSVPAASTRTAAAPGGSGSSASPVMESPISFIASAQAPRGF